MNLQQAVDFVRRTLRDAEAIMVRWSFDEQQADPFHHNWIADDFKEAIGLLLQAATVAPKPIGYVEPGKTYVLQITDWTEGGAEVLGHAVKVFKEIGCNVIILGPDMQLVSPPTSTGGKSGSSNPCDDCKERFECTGVCQRLSDALNKDDGHGGDTTPQGDVIVEDDDELG